MNVFDLRERLVSDYSEFVRSFIHIQDERIRETLERELDEGLLWPEPLIQLNPAYESAELVTELVGEGILHPKCGDIFRKRDARNPVGTPLRLYRHQSGAIRFGAIALVAFIVGVPWLAHGSPGSERLMWSIRVEGEIARLEVNHFDTLRQFPTEYVRVMRVVDSSQPVGDRLALDIRLELAPLRVNADGTLEAGERAVLEFYPPARVCRIPGGGRLTVLRMPGDELRATDVPVTYANVVMEPGEKLLGWEVLSPYGPAVLHTTDRTLLSRIDAEEPPGPIPFAVYPHRTYYVAISKGSGRFGAVVTTHEEARPRRSGRHMLVVFSPEGELIRETSPEECSYRQLYMTPSGETLIFRRACDDRPRETVALDIRTGALASVEVEDGTRYYSDDGSRMVVVQAGFGTATYYDVSDPFNPVRLGGYQVDGWITTAAACDDGSLLALQVTDEETTPVQRLLILDGSMQIVDEPITAEDALDMMGLQWEGKYLFVGTQEHPIPVYARFRTTRRVDVYDYSE